MRRDTVEHLLALREARGGGAVEYGQRHVGDDREVHYQALAEPVLRDIRDTSRHGGAGAGKAQPPAIDSDAPGSRLGNAEEDSGDFGATAPYKPSKADDLSLPHNEVDAFKFASANEAIRFENDVAGRRLVLWIEG